MIGETFGKWTVLKDAGKDKHGKSIVLCKCECGTRRKVLITRLKYGHSRSCGCVVKAMRRAINFAP